MNIQRHTRAARWLAPLVLPLVLSMLLAGCADYTDKRLVTYAGWKQSQPTPFPEAAQVPVRHAVRFPGPDTRLSDVEREALRIFLARNGVKRGSRVLVAGVGPVALSDGRIASVRQALYEMGQTPIATTPAASGVEPKLDEVVVTAHVTTVINPTCPGYNAPIVFDFEHRPIISPGCAVATNLGLMIAEPSDLIAGRELAPADADQQNLAVQRYRVNEVTPISEETTSQ
jgi:pilus assembly protein CpaD